MTHASSRCASFDVVSYKMLHQGGGMEEIGAHTALHSSIPFSVDYSVFGTSLFFNGI
jgi:hypothetical protein